MRLFRRGDGASTLDLLVAGLGNPGPRHERDRHNVGWMVVDELARRRDVSFRAKFNGRIGETRIADHRLALLKPETYMNESGRAVSAAARFYKVAPEDVLVVHDEVDLELGRLQARAGGGLAGHNGLRSIAQALGTSDFLRLRIGVGRPGPRRSARRGRLRAVSVRPPRGSGRARLPSRRRGRGARVRAGSTRRSAGSTEAGESTRRSAASPTVM